MDAPSEQPRKDEIDLRELLIQVWERRILVAIVTAVITLLTVGVSLVVPKTYKAFVVLSPISSSAGSGQLGMLSSVASQLGGLASLAGMSVGSDSKKSESIAVLQSEALTERYIEQNNLLPILYWAKWNPETNRWKIDRPEELPTLWKANAYFKKRIRDVRTDAKTGLVTLTITWRDPKVAAEWANGLVAVTNDYLRSKAIEESERNIAYLNEQAAKTSVVEAKQAIYKILETEINKLMLARGSNEYAFRVIDPAFAPEAPFSPQPLIWTSVGFFTGLLLSLFTILVRLQLT